MNWIRTIKVLSIVQLFSIVFVLSAPSVGFSKESKSSKSSSEKSGSDKDKSDKSDSSKSSSDKKSSDDDLDATDLSREDYKNIIKKLKDGESFTSEDKTTPQDSRTCRELREARKEFYKVCGKAPISGKCEEVAERCAGAESSQEFDVVDQLFQAYTGSGVPNGSSVCPKMSGTDFFKRKDEIMDKVKDINKDLSDLEKDGIDAKKELTDKSNEIQKTIQEATIALKDKTREDEKNQRDEAQKRAQNLMALNQQIRQKNTEKLNVTNGITQVMRKHNEDLIDLTVEMAEATCMAKYQELRTKFTSTSGGSGGEYFQLSSIKKKTLKNAYNACMKSYAERRAKLVENTRISIEQLEDRLRNIDAEIADAKDQIASMQSSAAQADKAMEQAKADAETDLRQKITMAQQELYNLNDSTNLVLQNLEKRKQQLQQESQVRSNQLSKLGGEPEDAASTENIKAVGAAYDNYKEFLDLHGDYCGAGPSAKKNASTAKPGSGNSGKKSKNQ